MLMVRFRSFYLDDFARIADFNNSFTPGVSTLNHQALTEMSAADYTQLCDGPGHQVVSGIGTAYFKTRPAALEALEDTCAVYQWASEHLEESLVIDRYLFNHQETDFKLLARNLPTHGLRRLISFGYQKGAKHIVFGVRDDSSVDFLRNYLEDRGFEVVHTLSHESGYNVDIYAIEMKIWVHKYYSMDVAHLIYLDVI